jgi:hypothetical protein
MAYTREIATEFTFPNITVWRVMNGETLAFWEVKTNEGYVMYDPNANNTEIDPDTLEEVPVTYYYTIKALNPRFNFDNFPWVAVPRDSVDENYIFGGGDEPEHEVM